jgi:pimeloyl-ACP methyl ester carboxylesterase
MRSHRPLAVLVLIYLGLSLVAGIQLCDGTLHPARRQFTPADEAQARSLAQRQHASLQDISITTSDHLQLQAWLLAPALPNQVSVILLHGLSDNRAGMLGYAELLLAHHFTVLLPDARAHGASEGALATYGLLERNDIRQWFDWLAQNQHPACIDGFGESMGAAQLLQSLAVEPRFCAVAAESSFSSFPEIGYDRVGQFFQTGPWLGRTLLRPALEFASGMERKNTVWIFVRSRPKLLLLQPRHSCCSFTAEKTAIFPSATPNKSTLGTRIQFSGKSPAPTTVQPSAPPP